MSDWNQQIPHCFSRDDLVFGSSPAERASAELLRTEIRQGSVCPSLLESAIEDWLHTETSNTGHLFEQMARVRAFFDGEPADR